MNAVKIRWINNNKFVFSYFFLLEKGAYGPSHGDYKDASTAQQPEPFVFIPSANQHASNADSVPIVKGFEFNTETIRRGFIRKVYSILSVRIFERKFFRLFRKCCVMFTILFAQCNRWCCCVHCPVLCSSCIMMRADNSLEIICGCLWSHWSLYSLQSFRWVAVKVFAVQHQPIWFFCQYSPLPNRLWLAIPQYNTIKMW